MSNELQALRSVRVYVEPAGSYGTDNTATPADFIDVPITEGFAGVPRTLEMLDPMLSQVYIDQRAERVVGKGSSAAQLSMLLASHGVSMVGNETPPPATTWALRRILGAIMGGVDVTGNEAAATTVQAGTTTTVVNVTTNHGDRWAKGRMMLCEVNASGTLEAREVLSVSTDAVTVKEAFSATPVTATQIGGAVSFYPTENPDTSLQLLCQGVETANNFVARGLQGGFQIECKPGQLAKISLDLKGCGTEILSAHSGINVPSIANWTPVACVATELTIPTVGSTTRVPVLASDFTVNLAFDYQPVTGFVISNNTIIRMRRQRPRDGVLARGTFTLPLEDSTWFTAQTARTDHAIFMQIGNARGGGWLLSFPTVQITNVAPGPSASGLSGIVVSWEARHDSSAGAVTTEMQRAAMRLHAW